MSSVVGCGRVMQNHGGLLNSQQELEGPHHAPSHRGSLRAYKLLEIRARDCHCHRSSCSRQTKGPGMARVYLYCCKHKPIWGQNDEKFHKLRQQRRCLEPAVPCVRETPSMYEPSNPWKEPAKASGPNF